MWPLPKIKQVQKISDAMKIKDLLISETENYIALHKPSGLLSIPDREGKSISLKEMLQQTFPNIFTVHRLDRDTSGLILFAKNAEAHKHYSAQFELRQTKKIYQGIVMGNPAPAADLISSPIAAHSTRSGWMIAHARGKEAITEYETLAVYRRFAFLQFRILTGRTHQIRVHMKEIGHPIVNDTMYGNGEPLLLSSLKKKFNLAKIEDEERPIMGRLALHALSLELQDVDDSLLQLKAPLPKDIEACCKQLQKWNSL